MRLCGLSTSFYVLSIAMVLATQCASNAAEPSTPPSTAELFPFVLPWDDATSSLTNVSHLLEKPAGKLGPVVVRDGHLYQGEKRFKLLGVNLCFAANFPEKSDADKIAARLAKFGINAVRFHHMDMFNAPGGIFAADGKTLDPGRLDRLDYLFSRLKAQGIYADLNLHVSRTYPGLPTWPGMPSFYKGIDHFDKKAIQFQKLYAKELLLHKNPYTKRTYAEDPAVAIVEINNENSLLFEWIIGELDAMPAAVGRPFTESWNGFLKAKYADDQALKAAWKVSDKPLGKEILKNATFKNGLDGWILEQHQGAKADASTVGSSNGVRIEVKAAGAQGWHLQFNQTSLRMEKDSPYTLSFKIKADAPRKASVGVGQAHAPYQSLWWNDLALTTDWTAVNTVIRPSSSDDNARLSFSNFADKLGGIEIADISLKPGGLLGLAKGEELGHIGWLTHRDYSSRTNEAQLDWTRFLFKTEEDYWLEMARYLKDDLGVKALLVGSQVGFSHPLIQSKLDVVDIHSYWQHPNFPGAGWDPKNWTIQNIPMAGRADGGTLPNLALSRVAGKPLICTEYNHSAPNTYAGETVPLITAFANFQDWDGVFLFAYSHRDDWGVAKIPSFFDIDQHPTKMATLPAAATLFHRGDLTPGSPTLLASPTLDALLDAARGSGPFVNASNFNLKTDQALKQTVALAIPGIKPATSRFAKQEGGWSWTTASNDKGTAKVDTARSIALMTTEVPGKFAFQSGVAIELAANRQNWAVVSLTAIDGPSLVKPGKILLTATGEAWNTGMKWTDDKKVSVGDDWGKSPSIVEGIPATITLPIASKKLSAFALDERGKARNDGVAVKIVADGPNRSKVLIGPAYKTLWYEIRIAP